MSASYFAALAERLRAEGVPADRVSGTIDDLAAYIEEAQVDPEAEFGPVAEFAERLAEPAADDVEPGQAAERWTWTADAFHDVQLLNRYGDEGWEVERIDKLGRFVSHRDLRDPQRWEYQRRVVAGWGAKQMARFASDGKVVPPEQKPRLPERLAAEGWEPCCSWMCFRYFKRPKAASIGPAAEVAAPPRTPARRAFWSRKFYAFMTGYLLVMAALATVLVLRPPWVPDGGVWGGFWQGFLVGGLLVTLWLIVSTIWERRRTR